MRGSVFKFRRLETAPLVAIACSCALAAGACLAADSTDTQRLQIIAKPAGDFSRPAARAATLGERLLFDARDGRLDDFDFLTAAVIASGAQTIDDVKKWLAMYEPVRAGIVGKLPAGTTSDRLKAIHAAAHQFVLTGAYVESASDLRMTFEGGHFNCLSSLAVCYDLCRSAGLNVQPILIRGHVALTYVGPRGQAQVFEPSTHEWKARSVNEISDSRALSPIQLLGKFYYNRGIEQLRASHYEAGLALLRISLALDSDDDDSRANLVAGLNNWAVEYARVKSFSKAALLIEQGLALDPDFAPLKANQEFVRAKLGK
jgi:hypothetical protein